MQPITAQVLDTCRIEIRDIPGTGPGDANPWTEPYPIGNKIMAASDRRDCDLSVFLDTDIVLSAPVDFPALIGEA